MLACFAIAAASALGHHFFYQSLDGQRVDKQTYNQNQNVYIGTALTALTKISLSAAVALGYSQILWRRLLGQKLRIAHVDSLASLYSTPAALDDWRILRDFPLLAALAVVAWCLSIITVFPPGTLSVFDSLENGSSNASVPTLDFTLPLVSDSERSIGHSGVNLEPNDTTNFTFPAELKGSAGAIGTVTAFTGVIPRLQTAASNSTHRTSFFGPALECSTKKFQGNSTYCSRGWRISYLSFLSFPQDRGSDFRKFYDLDGAVPIETIENTTGISCDSIASFRASTFGVYPPKLFVVAQSREPEEWVTTTCQLRNATYDVKVETTGNNQTIAVEVSDLSSLRLATEYIPNFNTSEPEITGPSANKIYNYFAMMAAIGQIVVGTVNSASDANIATYTEGGVISNNPAPFPGIFSTRLSTSPEIQEYATLGTPARVREYPFGSAGDGPPLARQLEELFRNMTVAMITSPATSSNATVPVRHWASVNLYSYRWWPLWLAYGIGLIATALIMALAFAAIASNGASYSTKFSTYLRTAPWSNIDEVLGDDKDGGADPLPREVARSMVMLGTGAASSGIEMVGFKQVSDGPLAKRSVSMDQYAAGGSHNSGGSSSPSVEETALVSPAH